MTDSHDIEHTPIGAEYEASSPDGKGTVSLHTVGILFVHGIGEQRQGDTLIRFAEPLVDWVQQWVKQSERLKGTQGEQNQPQKSRGTMRVTKSVLGPPPFSFRRPHYAIIEVEVSCDPETCATANPSSHRSTWLLAESWWAEEFHKPQFSKLAGWMLTTGTWMIISHAAKSVKLQSGWRWMVAVLLFVASFPLALLVQFLVVMLAVLALIPIPQLHAVLSSVLLGLTGSIGDSYILIESPLQAAAAATRVREDLLWLSRQCETVVIIAHSQGAAIAHRALQESEELESQNVRLFITLGQGLGKLEELAYVTAEVPVFFSWARFALPLAAFSLLFFLLPSTLPTWWTVLMLLSLATSLSSVICLAFNLWSSLLKNSQRYVSLSHLKWIDFYSAMDPVSNGPLELTKGDIPGIESTEVFNRMSLLWDHSAYWDNRDEFVSRVVCEIDKVAGTGLIWAADEARLAAAGQVRRRRVLCLFILRIVTLACVSISLVGLNNKLSSIGKGIVYSVLKEIPIFESVFQSVGLTAQGVISLVTDMDAEKIRSVGFTLLGAIIPLGIGMFLYVLIFSLWKWWDNLDTKFLLNPEAFRENRIIHRIARGCFVTHQFVVGMFFCAGLFPIVFAVATLLWPDYEQLRAKNAAVLHTVGLHGGSPVIRILLTLLLAFFAYCLMFFPVYTAFKLKDYVRHNLEQRGRRTIPSFHPRPVSPGKGARQTLRQHCKGYLASLTKQTKQSRDTANSLGPTSSRD